MLAALLVAACGQGSPTAPVPSPSPLMARALIYNSQAEQIGTATFTEAPGTIVPTPSEASSARDVTGPGVKISIDVSGLPPGQHGWHIHAVGRCDPPNFTSAGPHFNPFGKKHGAKNPDGLHAGDLGNLNVGDDGTAKTEVVDRYVSLQPEINNSLLQPLGTALVIHAGADDERTDPAGNSGGRIACGVIQNPKGQSPSPVPSSSISGLPTPRSSPSPSPLQVSPT